MARAIHVFRTPDRFVAGTVGQPGNRTFYVQAVHDARVVSVVLGAKSFKGREDASGALINYAFTFYDTKLVAKGGAKLASAHVWKAAATPVDVGVNEDLYVTLPRSASSDIKTTVDVQPKLIAPLSRSADVGVLHVLAGTQSLASVPVHPLGAVPQGGWWRRLIDTIRLWFA